MTLDHVRAGERRRASDAPPLRIGNFWAWHIKEDREASLLAAVAIIGRHVLPALR